MGCAASRVKVQEKKFLHPFDVLKTLFPSSYSEQIRYDSSARKYETLCISNKDGFILLFINEHHSFGHTVDNISFIDPICGIRETLQIPENEANVVDDLIKNYPKESQAFPILALQGLWRSSSEELPSASLSALKNERTKFLTYRPFTLKIAKDCFEDKGERFEGCRFEIGNSAFWIHTANMNAFSAAKEELRQKISTLDGDISKLGAATEPSAKEKVIWLKSELKTQKDKMEKLETYEIKYNQIKQKIGTVQKQENNIKKNLEKDNDERKRISLMEQQERTNKMSESLNNNLQQHKEESKKDVPTSASFTTLQVEQKTIISTKSQRRYLHFKKILEELKDLRAELKNRLPLFKLPVLHAFVSEGKKLYKTNKGNEGERLVLKESSIVIDPNSDPKDIANSEAKISKIREDQLDWLITGLTDPPNYGLDETLETPFSEEIDKKIQLAQNIADCLLDELKNEKYEKLVDSLMQRKIESYRKMNSLLVQESEEFVLYKRLSATGSVLIDILEKEKKSGLNVLNEVHVRIVPNIDSICYLIICVNAIYNE